MTDITPPELPVTPPRPSIWRNLSPVWIVPVLAILLSLGIAWQNWQDRGTLIRIYFENGAGLVPGETTVRYRDVAIGRVERVDFSADLRGVVASARITDEVADTLPADAQFWVVRPQVTTRGVTGLNTVLSGVYVEGAWEPAESSGITDFRGLEEAPPIRPGRQGTRVTLRSTDGTLLPEGAPVFYKGIEVGTIANPRISEDGDAILADAYILAPHDRLLSTGARFWDTSGFSVRLGAGGLELNVTSIGALLSGGVAFETAFSGGDPVRADTVFTLYVDEASARESVFNTLSADAVEFVVEFDETVAGLAAGAPVEYRGLRVGQVTAIGAIVVQEDDGPRVRLRANLRIDPQSLGLTSGGPAALIAYLEQAVASGLRARLATSSIFSAGLKIELAEVPDTPPAQIAQGADGVPVLPSVVSDLPDFTATAEGVLERINALPVEELMNQAISLMASIEAVAASEGVRRAPDAVVALLDETRALVGGPDAQALPGELRATVAELRAVVGELRTEGTIARLTDALEKADAALTNVREASADLPALVADLREVAAKARALRAEELVDAATRVLTSADALIGTPEARALPPALTGALDEVRAALADLRAGGAVENFNATMASARAAAGSVAEAADGFPALAERLEGVVARLDGLVGAYGAGSEVNTQTLDVLREIRAAARSIAQLARTIERNPNSLLIGR